MNKLCLLLLSALICYGEVGWSSEQEISLGKDQSHTLRLLVDSNDLRELSLKWTLFVDGGLVLLAKYDSFHQHTILYQKSKKDAIRINLNAKSRRGVIPPYVAIFFKGYDQSKKSATLKIATYGDVYIQ
ncbi:hypothetical protein [Helicobacter pametensis]|uniref:hypothetical protein n=1 Tax=Helicobacter pametensis TaxID=95149 RepID=UPI0004878FD3|nr:hypothetical protein [Helicobacter pametensis]